MDTLARYRKQALKRAVIVELGDDEGFAARIPGFRGLLGSGETKREALVDLEGALKDWIDLALKCGHGLPAIRRHEPEVISAR